MIEPLKETVYSSAPTLLNPVGLFNSMVSDLMASRELAWCLLIRNISAQYRQTVLGYLWAFVPPLFMTAVWVFLSSRKVLDVGDTGIPYPLYVLTGMILWQIFVDAINSPLKIINDSRSMLTKVNFPREALILAGIGEVIFNFMVRLLLLIPVCIYYSSPLSASVLLAPIGVVSLTTLGLMIGLLLTPLGVLYNDISRVIFVVMQPWFFLTPVIYPVTEVSLESPLISFNPVTPVLVITRDWITANDPQYLIEFIIVSFITGILLVAGWFLYRLAMPHLISRISA